MTLLMMIIVNIAYRIVLILPPGTRNRAAGRFTGVSSAKSSEDTGIFARSTVAYIAVDSNIRGFGTKSESRV